MTKPEDENYAAWRAFCLHCGNECNANNNLEAWDSYRAGWEDREERAITTLIGSRTHREKRL